MKTTSGILLAAVSFATAAMMQSCEKKDLCYDHGHMVDLQINFDWSQAPDADPHTMVVRLFRPDGSHYAVYELTNTTADHIRVEAGEYIMLCHNGEMDNVTEIEGDYTDYALTTRPRALLAPMNRGDEQLPPRPGMSTGELVRSTPERVWAVQGEVLNLLPKVKGQNITVTPREATSHCTVTITKVENLNPGIDISGAITGMSEGWNVAGAHPAGDAVTHPVPIEQVDDHTLRAEFYIFGHCHDNDSPHFFSVYTSNNIYKDFNITDQLHSAENSHEIHIELEGLTLTIPGTGMSPGVSGWGEVVNTDIDMK